MNKIYKVIWSKIKNCWVVVSEITKSKTKAPKSSIFSRTLVAGILTCIINIGLCVPGYAANFTGGVSGRLNYSGESGYVNGTVTINDTELNQYIQQVISSSGNSSYVAGNGSVTSGNTGLLNGGMAYTELRPSANGNYVNRKTLHFI